MITTRHVSNAAPRHATAGGVARKAGAVAGCGFLVAVFVAAGQSPALSQSYVDTGNPNVTVDLSVLEDGGMGPPSMAIPPSFGGGGRLLMPGARAPMSEFHPPPGSKLGKLRLPEPSAEKSRVGAAPKMARKTAPTLKAPVLKAPKPAVAKAKPKPEAKPKAAPAVAVKAPEAPPPAKAPVPAVTASSAPPPPPAPPKMTAPPAPKIAAAPKPPVVPAAAPEKAEPKAPEAKAPAPQVAAVPKSVAAEKGNEVRVLFAENATKLPDQAKTGLKSLASGLKGKGDLRLQLKAYAGGESLSASKARRLSLSRALSVRSYLIETGVRSTRIDVRALGNNTTDEPVNRVDVIVVER